MAKQRKHEDERDATREVALLPQPPTDLLAGNLNPAAQAFLQELQGEREVPRGIPLISIDHKEGVFVLPSGEIVPEIAGYPIYYFQTRRFYERPPMPGSKGQPPDCWSGNLIEPSREAKKIQHATCVGCPQAEWGTARDGRGQACSTQTWVFLLNPQFGNPPLGVIVFPPSSIRRLLGTRTSPGYFGRAGAKHGAYEIVWTVFELEAQSGQVPFCVVNPIMGEVVSNVETAKVLSRVRNDFKVMMDALRGQPSEVPISTEESE